MLSRWCKNNTTLSFSCYEKDEKEENNNVNIEGMNICKYKTNFIIKLLLFTINFIIKNIPIYLFMYLFVNNI